MGYEESQDFDVTRQALRGMVTDRLLADVSTMSFEQDTWSWHANVGLAAAQLTFYL